MPPDAPVGDQFVEALEASRRFLLTIANAEFPDALRPKGGASDLVQETMAAAHQSRCQFHGRTVADLRAWLRAILTNELAAFHRRYTATAARDVRREASMKVGCAAPHAAPIDTLIGTERDERLMGAVARLPDDSRHAVLLRIEENLSFAAIGARLGRTEEAARKLFVRALNELRESVDSIEE